jgi:nitronate monooxygenase
MATARNRLCELTRCTLPLIAAPMLGCGDVALARAAASTGAVGSVPCSGMAAEQLHALVQANMEYRLCYNFFCHRPPPATAAVLSMLWMAHLETYYAEEGVDNPGEAVQRRIAATRPTHFTEEQLAVLLEVQAELSRQAGAMAPPLLLSFHFGLPPDALWERLRTARKPAFCVSCSATTVEEAVYLHQRGVDVVVCQGAEAGGHRGLFLPRSRVEEQPGTFALVPQVRSALGPDACLVAAGGIVDAATARAAVALGADGVQVGTALLRTAEAKTTAVHRAALRDARESGVPATSVTNLLSGRPARGLRNRLMAELGSMRTDGPTYPFGPAYLLDLRQKAEAAGRGDYSPLWAGQNLRGCTEGGAADKVREIAAAFTRP